MKQQIQPWDIELIHGDYTKQQETITPVPTVDKSNERREKVLSVVDRIASEVGAYQVVVSPDGTVTVGKPKPATPVPVKQSIEPPFGFTWNQVALGAGVIGLAVMLGRR